MSNQIDGSNVNGAAGINTGYMLTTPPMHHHHHHGHHAHMSGTYGASVVASGDPIMANPYTAHVTATPTVATHHQAPHFAHHSPHSHNSPMSPYGHQLYQQPSPGIHHGHHMHMQSPMNNSPHNHSFGYQGYNTTPTTTYYQPSGHYGGVKTPSTPTSIHAHHGLCQQQQQMGHSPKMNVAPKVNAAANPNAAYLTLLGLADKFRRSGNQRQAIHCLEAILVLRPQVGSAKIELEVRLHLVRMYVQHVVLDVATNQIVINHLDKAVISNFELKIN